MYNFNSYNGSEYLLKLIFLGTSGSFPSKDKMCPAILVEDSFLIDCGEGALHRLLNLNIDLSAIEEIFISHSHADHISSLPMLLWTMWLQGRKSKLTIYGPPNIQNIVETILKHMETTPEKFHFTIRYGKFSTAKNLGEFEVLPVAHSILTFAIKMDDKFVYTSDTAPYEPLIEFAKNCKLLIHETTFPDEMKQEAHKHNHSSPSDAAMIASKANVEMLSLFHIPPSFQNLEESFTMQARKWFKGKIFVARDLEILKL